MFELRQNQAQKITFVMVNTSGIEVPGLGSALTVQVSQNGAAYAPAVGAVSEMGGGWYAYSLTAAETNTPGPLSIIVTGAGCLQQNLAYSVADLLAGAITFTYTLTDATTSLPLPDATVWIATDPAGLHIIWRGHTDAAGIARDDLGNLPRATPGTYYFFRYRTDYSFTDPDVEVIS